MSDEMDEIISEFVTEAEETLDRIDPLFVELENRGYDKDMLNEIFRGMHTLKGAAGFLGFQQIVDVAHRAESIMKRLRDNGIAPSRGLMDIILTSVDMLRVLIGHVKVRDGAEEDISELLSRLDIAMEGPLDEPLAIPPLPSPAVAPRPEPVAAAAVPPPAESVQPEPELEPQPVLKPEPVGHVEVLEPKKDVPPSPPQKPASGADEPVQQASKEREVAATLRVDVSRIDKVMDLAGEIVLARNRLLNLASKLESQYNGDQSVESLLETTSFLDRVTSDLQLAVMKMRMQQIAKVFSKFPRMVRDLSRALGKDIDLEIYGEETEVDKSVIENIGDPMVHIIRNSIDHGLEMNDERESKGKPRNGRIIISAYQQGTQIVIEVTDDGRGIDVDAVRRKAIKNGLVSEDEAEKMSDEAAINMIFLPGFSTKEVSTELSGRGVGMDVVKTNVAKLNGYVEVVTKKDIGSTFRISLPLTLAIMQAMMVRIGSEYYSLPQSMIEETLRVKRQDIKDVTGQQVLTIRGKVLPLFVMSELLGVRSADARDQENSYVLVASVAERRFCIVVDELLGQEEVVLKAINGVESEECGILGATITGDGRVVLILDLAVIARRIFLAGVK